MASAINVTIMAQLTGALDHARSKSGPKRCKQFVFVTASDRVYLTAASKQRMHTFWRKNKVNKRAVRDFSATGFDSRQLWRIEAAFVLLHTHTR